LTLFLSIEVSKSMLDVSVAKACGDKALALYSEKRVECFTAQLNESNPILTEISNAMTEEGMCQEQLKSARACVARTDDAGGSAEEEVTQWTARMEAAKQRKLEGNRKLMECSARYEKRMRSIREAGT
jgi:peptidoglycan hydrolase CwlO-like protein